MHGSHWSQLLRYTNDSASESFHKPVYSFLWVKLKVTHPVAWNVHRFATHKLTGNHKPYPLYRPLIIWFVQTSIVAMASPSTNLLSSTSITTPTTPTPPSLPWGDINVLVLTDVHSWVGGHDKYGKGKEPYLNVDYGKVLSFYQYLKQYCDETNKDFWFVMNGDWIDGTGACVG